MSEYKKQDGGLFTTLIAVILANLLLALVFVVELPFRFFRQQLSDLFFLEKGCAYWPVTKWALRPLKWISVLGFTYALSYVIGHFWGKVGTPVSIFTLALYLAASLLCSLIFNLIDWMQELFDAPATQRKIAGLQAERFVEKMIEAHLHRFPAAQTIHGALFVFDPGTKNEYSVEIDHLLITQKNVFVIETKYKTGIIYVEPTAPTWNVISNNGTRQMRNALEQVKHTARVIEKQFGLSVTPVPVVAIKGNEVELVGAPTNVTRANELFSFIEALEMSAKRTLQPEEVARRLLQHRSNDKLALERHIERAVAARRRSEMTQIVNSASLH